MIQGVIIKEAAKFLRKQFKLDKVLAYVEEDNPLDHKVRDLEDKVIMLESKIKKSNKKGE